MDEFTVSFCNATKCRVVASADSSASTGINSEFDQMANSLSAHYSANKGINGGLRELRDSFSISVEEKLYVTRMVCCAIPSRRLDC